MNARNHFIPVNARVISWQDYADYEVEKRMYEIERKGFEGDTRELMLEAIQQLEAERSAEVEHD